MTRARPPAFARSSGARVTIALAAVGVCGALASLGPYGCSAPGEPPPVASFASSTASSAAFAQIRDAWVDPAKTSPAALRGMLDRFIRDFPHDGLEPVARAYRAYLALDDRDFARADAELRQLGGLPPGSTRDLVTTVRASWERLHGNAAGAMRLLRPNIGKNVDPIARNLFEEELALAALASDEEHDQYEALAYMDAWLQGAADEEREATRREVSAIVEKMPREVLEGAIKLIRVKRAASGYGPEIFRIMSDRLAKIALKDGDAELARLLLDPSAGASVVAGDAGAELADLSTSRRGLNVIEGRTIGLLLPTEAAELRDESADVLRGVMWALGKPRGIRRILTPIPAPSRLPSAAPMPPAASPAASPAPIDPSANNACAREASADDSTLSEDEPSDDDAISLVTRDDAGNAARTEASLDEMVGEGASVIIAALDPKTADRAMRWSAAHAVPVIVLTPPATEQVSAHAFVLGEPLSRVLEALVRAAPELANTKVAPVVDASELADFPTRGGTLGPLAILAPVSCDTPTPHAGDPRFPLVDWEKASARAWLVTGSAACARDVSLELSTRGRSGVVALTLAAAAWLPSPKALRVISAAAGLVPIAPGGVARNREIDRFVAAYGVSRLTWWTALGRDAATLSRRIALSLPKDSVSLPAQVAERRASAERALFAARARLWSTESRGFAGKNVISRSICAIENHAAR